MYLRFVVYRNYSSLVKILIGSNAHVFFFLIKNSDAKQLVRFLSIVNDGDIFFAFQEHSVIIFYRQKKYDHNA